MYGNRNEYGHKMIDRSPRPPLWECPVCHRQFPNANQSHACGIHDIEHHFRNRSPGIRALYDRFVEAIDEVGPVIINPEKTRIAFQVRMSFAQITPRNRWLDGHLVLARRCESPMFSKIETFSPRNHIHVFRIVHASDINEELRGYLRDAYAVGEQKHLDL